MIYYWWLYIIIIALFLVYKYSSRNANFWSDKGVNGPKPVPLFGNSLESFKTSITELELQRSKKYGKIYGYLEFTQPVLTISDVELIKLVTMKDFNCFTNHSNWAPGDPLLSKLLVNMVDDEWKRVRNICIPAFTTNRVREMFQLVNVCVNNALVYFDEMAAMQIPVELQKLFSSFAVDVVAHTTFGIEVNSFKDPDGDYTRKALNLVPISSPRVVIGLLMPSVIRRLVGYNIFSPSSVGYFRKLVRHVINERRAKDSQHKCLLTILYNAEMNDIQSLANLDAEGVENAVNFDVKHGKRKLDEDEILAQCLQVIVAGTETTAITITYCLFTMATRPDIQDKLYSELKQYFALRDEKHDYDSLMSLPYLNAVLNETLRRYSPVVQFDRVANCDYELGDTGITISKGTIINIPFHAIHHDPDYWQEPFEFKPERFLPENKSEIVPYTFAPFGYGPRICLGMKLGMLEIKVLLAKLLHRFEVLKTPKTPLELKYTGKKFNNHCEPIFVVLKRRTE